MYVVKCTKCGKKLMNRLDNGIWEFMFGRYGNNQEPVVSMEIHGSVRIVCLKKSCRHVNLLDYFPNRS